MTRYDWMADLGLDIASLSDGERARWLDRLLAIATGRVGSTRRAVVIHDDPMRHRALSVGDDDSPCFCIVESDYRCFVAGIGAANNEAVDEWRADATSAFETMHHLADYPWSAIIGSHPQCPLMGRPLRLAGEAALGPTRLTPLGIEIVEQAPRTVLDFGRALKCSFPIKVEGVAQVSDPTLAQADAAGLLRTVCGVLSIAWTEPLTLRVSPRFDGDDLAAYLNPLTPPEGMRSEMEPYDVRIEPWAEAALVTVLSPENRDLADAVDAYLDAELLIEQFPSQSLRLVRGVH